MRESCSNQYYSFQISEDFHRLQLDQRKWVFKKLSERLAIAVSSTVSEYIRSLWLC